MDGKTCGSWLLTGIGDGTELRDQQKVASQHWNLATLFCQMHQLPLSTKYLTVLARNNDWVGFLSEAQIGGYPFDSVVQVATKEFSDPHLKIHLLTVLKGMQLRKKSGSPAYSYTGENGSETFCFQEDMLIPAELFRILANYERKKNPGESLLKKAKEMSWSTLAMIASCFPDVSPLSCLTVWLEITAARETSSIKVNDIASQIADNVEAAVETTNSLPAGSRVLTVHYNRQNAKRRRLMEPMYMESSVATDDVSTTYGGVTRSASQGTVAEEERKVDFGEKNVSSDSGEESVSLSKMVAVLHEQQLFLPLLRAFEMIKDEQTSMQANIGIEGQVRTSWISSTAVKAANAMLLTCPSPYEKRSEPSLRKGDALHLGNRALDDASLLEALEKSGHWEQARNWARQLDASGGPWKSAVHHVTEIQAESMVAEWKEFLWDVPEERVALWGHLVKWDDKSVQSVLESLATMFTEGSGRGLCKRIIAVVKAANVLGLSFSEAFDKQPIELLRLLALKAQESFEEASLIVQTHSMPAASIAQILAESFLKHQKDAYRLPGFGRTGLLSLPPALLHKVHNKMEQSRSLHDMAHLLEIIQNLQYRLSSKFKKTSLGLVDGRKELSLVEANLSQDESQLSILSADAALSETPNQQELLASVSPVGSNNEKFALMYRDSLDFRTHLDIEDSNGVSFLLPQGHHSV
ncbi:hypothetical protein OIU74_022250 [Salix koriyanagi]|uniref:Uncharacterized protein n=1 Tax=Salix koriyanagi TaxID=2511006 RepID=A0A9Q1AES7_9ROSI|nr:hypothetical protein OIU74_022250 [Salix koriyanagi]